ncbi:hypothetical protein MAUB_04890 [Mycolicibacterium aubagnense]|uniref:Transposase n=1 Tax=Mycolicibacterium aubagnense TaxID=319707 RepID=A0ABM7I789_9MYCO|nr:hypothetical protein MAUB_04890 [Mycolicibacterium aubagnense]
MLVRNSLQHSTQISANTLIPQWGKPFRESVIRQRTHSQRRGGEQSPPRKPRPQKQVKPADETWDVCSGQLDRSERPRREVFKGITVSQHQPTDEIWVAGAQNLAQRATGVIADNGDVVQLKSLDELGEHGGKPRR